MARQDAEELKELIRKDIEADRAALQKLREQVARIEPRLAQSIRFYRARFDDSDLPGDLQGGSSVRRLRVGARRRGRISHANHAAVALTELGLVGTFLTVDEIRKAMVERGLGKKDYPSRATLASMVVRSPLFEKSGKRGRYVLQSPMKREDLPHASKEFLEKMVAGVTAGNEETPSGNSVTQGSEAAPAPPE